MMKIGPSTIGAVVFTAVAVAAFGWLTQRPKVETQAVGFAMPSEGSTSKEVTEETGSTSSTESTEEKTEKTAEAKQEITSGTESTEQATEQQPSEAESTKELPEPKEESSEIEKPEASETDETKPEDKTEKESAVEDSTNSESTSEQTQTDTTADAGTAEQAANRQTASQEQETTESSEQQMQKEAEQEEAPTAEQQQVNQATQTTAESSNQQTQADQTKSDNVAADTTEAAEAKTEQQEKSSLAPQVQNLMTKPVAAATAGAQTNNQAATDATLANQQEPEAKQESFGQTSAIEPVQITGAQGNVAGVYTKAQNAKGTVIIVHGCDYKPEGDSDIVGTLHKNLPNNSWNTLSIQMPNMSAYSNYATLDGLMPDAAARIESGISIAKQKSQKPIVLLGHGCGSQMALAWMEVKGSDAINAYIGLGTGVMNTEKSTSNHLQIPMESMKFPQLDIYGSMDNEAVLQTVPERLSYINRAANPSSRQKVIQGADHNMTGKGKDVTAMIADWLNTMAFK